MKSRLDYRSNAPMAVRKLYEWSLEIKKGSIPEPILNLVYVRASQINQCAYCIDVHVRDALEGGESHERLHAVAAWEESPLYTDKERAALKWCESVTLLSKTHVPDSVYDYVRVHFNDKELVDLTMAVASINAWNRLSVSFRMLPEAAKSVTKTK